MVLKPLFNNENEDKNRKEANVGRGMKSFLYSDEAQVVLNKKVIQFSVHI